MELSSITPGPAQLRALAHPVRLRMLGLLRAEGPATATTLASRLGLNSGATSYHLRQLATHGFVVDDETLGNRRDRWWRAAHQSTRTDPAEATTTESRDSLDAFLQAVAVIHTDLLQHAVEERELLPDEWRAASTLSDWGIRLTPARARALVETLLAVVEETEEEDAGTEEAADFLVVLQAYPRPGTVAQGPDVGGPP